ncbi:MAG: TIR domain-containing protein [Leptolyngbyaceae cyanobacterium SM2_5_2]|nr:TIR domain-containing protein [Leptolyngbyaceae cyanobacterium SM2_5_2]
MQEEFLQASRQESSHGAPPSIFISYSRRDVEFVNQLVQALKDKGFIIWLDRENIPIAANWQDEVEKGIASAHTFIFVISPNSVKSEHCALERDLAGQLGTRIIPICCNKNYEQKNLDELRLGLINFVDFQDLDFPVAFAQLVEALKTDLKDAETYNELSRKAYDWNHGGQKKEYLLSRSDCRRLEKWLYNRNVTPSKVSCLSEVKELSKRYLTESRNHLNRQRNSLLLASTMLGGLIFALSGVAVKSDLGEIDALVSSLEQKQGLEGLVTALRASEKLEGNLFSSEKLHFEAITALHKELLGVRELNMLKGHERGVFDVAFSPKGEYLVSGGEDKTIRVWDFSGKELAVYQQQQHDDRVIAIEFSPDGDFFLSASYDGKVNLWSCQPDFLAEHIKDYVPLEQHKSDTPTLDCRFVKTLTPENSNAGIVRLSVSPNGQHIAAASLDKKVYLWTRGEDLYQQQQIFLHTAVPWGLDFSANSSILVSADQSGQMLVRAIGSKQVAAKQNIGRFVTDVRFSRDGRWIAIGGENGLLKLWDLQQNKLVDLPGHSAGFVRVMFSPNDNTLASADTLGNMYLWKPNVLEAALQPDADKKLLPLTLKGHQDGISRIRFSPDGRYLASTSLDDTIRLWLTTEGDSQNDSRSPTAPESYAVLEGHEDEVLNVAFSPPNGGDQSSAYLATTSRDSTIRLWRTQTGIQPLTHENRLFDIDFHPQQDVLATGGTNSISLWDLSNYKRKKIEYNKPGIGKPDDLEIVSIDYSPSGEFLVAGDSKGEIRLWQPDISIDSKSYYAKKQKSHRNLAEKVLVDGVFVVRFSPDGTFIASGGADGKVKFWDTSKEMKLLGAEAFINSNDLSCAVVNFDFSADGKQLIVASNVNQVKVSQDPTQASKCSIKIYQIKIDPRSRRIELKRARGCWPIRSFQSDARGFTGCLPTKPSILCQ